MNERKLYAAACIFIIVTIVKLLFPAQTNQIRRDVVTLIDMDMDYRSILMEAGAYLTEENIERVVHVFSSSSDYEDKPIPTAEWTTPIPDSSTEQGKIPASVLAAVEAFRVAQSAYSDYEVPDNVTYSDLLVPFAYTSPVDGALSSGFGYRVHPLEHTVLFHYGTDYDVNEGTPIGAFSDGEVVSVGTEAGYGNYVELLHEDGWTTLYAHCSEVLVKNGQRVSMGEVIAKSGKSGLVTGPHLHFELMHNDLYTNPEFFLS